MRVDCTIANSAGASVRLRHARRDARLCPIPGRVSWRCCADATAEPALSSDEHEIQMAITDAVSDSAAALVEQIERTLRFLESQRHHQHPTSLWLMGGGASVRNIGPYLSSSLQMPVCIWNVPGELHGNGLVRGQQNALFGTAVALSALAWRAA